MLAELISNRLLQNLALCNREISRHRQFEMHLKLMPKPAAAYLTHRYPVYRLNGMVNFVA